jgi:cell division protein FtsW (lipid II flippase)
MTSTNIEMEKKYKIAIEARDKLNDNYHKWMTFYYVANGAVLVAITTLSSKQGLDKGIFILSLIGVLICMIWNLSCKGYYYWSNSWIDLIIELEKKVFGNDDLVYGAFSKKVAEEEKPTWYPLEPNNISTPKLTLIFSLISLLSWTIYSIYSFNIQFQEYSSFNKKFISILIGLTIILCYIGIPKVVKSRKEGKHKLTQPQP